MNVLDGILLVAALLAAWSGWRQGLIGGVLSFAGFVSGAIVGALLAPRLVGGFEGPLRLALGVGIVLVGAGIGNAVATFVANRIRELVTWRPAQLVDAGAGALFGVFAVAFVAWMLASAALSVPLGPLSTQVRGSTVLGGIDRVMPDETRSWISGLRSALDSTGLPQAISGFTLEPIIPVEPPDPALLRDPAVRKAWASTVKVQGIASACSTEVDGSGFVYADERVMTNAHVVAGVDEPQVLVGGGGRPYAAQVVLFDPLLDVAVLKVPGLPSPRLQFAGEARRGDAAVVAGYPGGGPFSATPARIRGLIDARGTDITGSTPVTREVYSFRGSVRPGNSGGPLLSPEGKVDGVVFAAAIGVDDTGYALTAKQVAASAAEGITATDAVATGSCQR